MYPLGTWFVSGICVWIPCIKETMMMMIIIIIIYNNYNKIIIIIIIIATRFRDTELGSNVKLCGSLM